MTVTKESFIEAIGQLDGNFNDKGTVVAQKRFLQSIIDNIKVKNSQIKINYWLKN